MDENVALTLILASHATLIKTQRFPQENKNNFFNITGRQWFLVYFFNITKCKCMLTLFIWCFYNIFIQIICYIDAACQVKSW